MPKLRQSPKETMDRAFLAALRYGQTMKGDTNMDTVKLLPCKRAAFYNRLKDPDLFTREELRILVPRYFTDRQLCEAFGVEYHGGTQP